MKMVENSLLDSLAFASSLVFSKSFKSEWQFDIYASFIFASKKSFQIQKPIQA